MSFSVVSTYSGAGGLDLGFRASGMIVSWANDIDASAVRTHEKLFGGGVANHGDIRDQRLPRPGTADIVVGGPPCQGFSVAGRMDPDDPRSRHIFDFLDVATALKPRAFVMENVKALALNRRWTPLRDALIERSVAMGYNTQLLILNASHFGVPQARERMFLIGLRGGPLAIPLPTTAMRPPTVRSALQSLPQLGEAGNDTVCSAIVTPARTPVLRKSPFAGMLFNGQGRPLDLDRPASTLPASMGGNRTPIVDQAELDDGEENWVVEYHRHLMAGGKPASHVPPRLRRLSVEEAAAIQTFPRGMTWCGPQSAQYRQIGNAVPPLLAEHVALSVRRSLEGEQVSPPAGWLEEYQLVYRAA